jgi:feruloyl esterase
MNVQSRRALNPAAVGLALLVCLIFARSVAGQASACTAERFALPAKGTEIAAAIVPKGAFVPPVSGGSSIAGLLPVPFASLSEFCRVSLTLRPTSDSDIKAEVWMPASGWNGKLLVVGNGGWGGVISYPALSTVLARGYATASTDAGHATSGGAFVLGHPEKYVDNAYRAVHETAAAAKSVVAAYYRRSPTRSYWNGCSTGGRQGLFEAQRFPEDFDGIVAGDPANPRTRLIAWQLTRVQATLANPATIIPPAAFPVIHEAVLKQCDGLDGLKDGLLSDPTRCHFDATVLACKAGASAACLTPEQVGAVEAVLKPLTDPRTGAEVFPSWEAGTELRWGAILDGQPSPLTLDFYRYAVFGDPNWNWRTFDASRDLAVAEDPARGLRDAVDPDISAFIQRGGKLLMYHGWADQLVPPRASVNYYSHVLSTLGGSTEARDGVRLFMLPGMGHCRGGEGPNVFDTITALEDWVERGKPPTRIVSRRFVGGTNDIERSRPICAYPEIAVYTGRGSIDDEAHFTCRVP